MKIPEDLVPHPRYGKRPCRSSFSVPARTLRESFWSYRSEVIFPETALPANLEKQRTGLGNRPYYVDILKECRACGRAFLFFAQEQRYWYEELGFIIYANCVRCCECRHDIHEVRRRFGRYGELINDAAELDPKQLMTLVEETSFLWDEGILRKEDKLRRICNLAKAKLPNRRLTKHIVGQVEKLREDSE